MLISKRPHLLFAGLIAAGLISTPAFAQAHKSQHATPAETKSAKPVADTWITTKVKGDLLATKDVSGLDIKVETVNGIVKLSGKVDSQAQIDKASELAKKIDGVHAVDASALIVESSAK